MSSCLSFEIVAIIDDPYLDSLLLSVVAMLAALWVRERSTHVDLLEETHRSCIGREI